MSLTDKEIEQLNNDALAGKPLDCRAVSDLVKMHRDLMTGAGELAAKVVWALKYMSPKTGGMVAKHRHDGSFKLVGWVDDFFDALKGVGIEVDRAKLDEIRHPKRPSARKARKA